MENQETPPPEGGEQPPPPAEAPPTQPVSAPGGLAKAKALYDKLLPAGSPQRKFGPLILAVPVIIVFLLLKSGVSTVSEKVTAVQQVRAEEHRVATTGVLVVTSNRPEATVEAKLLDTAPEGATTTAQGALGQSFSNLAPGRYAVTLRAAGWPDALGEVDVPAGQKTAFTANFKGGSLNFETVPAGAIVKLGKDVLGKTPLTVPLLPPGDLTLSLEFQNWAPVPWKGVITVDQETAASVRLPHGRLTVGSIPAGAIVVLEGKSYQQTPLFFDPVSAGEKKLTLQAEGFPPLEVSVTVADGEEAKINPVLATGFPVLDPGALLRDVWIIDDRKVFNAHTGVYRPKNDVIKNLHRQALYDRWQRKSFRFSSPVKSYDATTRTLEFDTQKADPSSWRVLAQLKPGAGIAAPPAKGAVLAVYGRLTAVEEPVWPLRVITVELSDADLVPETTP